MNSWDKRYSDRVQLLVDILPVLAKNPVCTEGWNSHQLEQTLEQIAPDA